MPTTVSSSNHIVDIVFQDITMVNNTAPILGPIVNDNQRHITIFVNRVVIGQILALFGIGTNIVNISLFYKMGFKESINISLFGLAISDFMSCLTLAWGNLCFTPAFNELDLPFRPLEIRYLTDGIPHYIFVKISGCITAYVAFERCFCVVFPLQVKQIITPKKVTIFVICAYVFVLGLYSPVYYVSRLAWKFYPHVNKTLLGLVFLPNRWEIEQWVLPIRGTFLTWFLFGLISICTAVLVLNLKKKSEWRNKASAVTKDNSKQLSSRDAKVSTLVIFISAVFIACFIPQSTTVVAMSVEKEISVNGRYKNLWAVFFSVNSIFEATNASINIFIYYFRSSKYKAMFDQIFFRKTTSD